jgi:hypothetical protein
MLVILLVLIWPLSYSCLFNPSWPFPTHPQPDPSKDILTVMYPSNDTLLNTKDKLELKWVVAYDEQGQVDIVLRNDRLDLEVLLYYNASYYSFKQDVQLPIFWPTSKFNYLKVFVYLKKRSELVYSKDFSIINHLMPISNHIP